MLVCLVIIVCANDVVWRRRYCDHFVMMCVGVWVCTRDWDDLKLGTQ